MTNDEINQEAMKVWKILNDKVKNTLCPSCGRHDYIISHAYVKHDDGTFEITTLYLTCRDCGQITSHDARLLVGTDIPTPLAPAKVEKIEETTPTPPDIPAAIPPAPTKACKPYTSQAEQLYNDCWTSFRKHRCIDVVARELGLNYNKVYYQINKGENWMSRIKKFTPQIKKRTNPDPDIITETDAAKLDVIINTIKNKGV